MAKQSNRRKLRDAIAKRLEVDIAGRFPLNKQQTTSQNRADAKKAADMIVARELKAIAKAKKEGRIKESVA